MLFFSGIQCLLFLKKVGVSFLPFFEDGEDLILEGGGLGCSDGISVAHAVAELALVACRCVVFEAIEDIGCFHDKRILPFGYSALDELDNPLLAILNGHVLSARFDQPQHFLAEAVPDSVFRKRPALERVMKEPGDHDIARIAVLVEIDSDAEAMRELGLA